MKVSTTLGCHCQANSAPVQVKVLVFTPKCWDRLIVFVVVLPLSTMQQIQTFLFIPYKKAWDSNSTKNLCSTFKS
jgi:hypothetical protein